MLFLRAEYLRRYRYSLKSLVLPKDQRSLLEFIFFPIRCAALTRYYVLAGFKTLTDIMLSEIESLFAPRQDNVRYLFGTTRSSTVGLRAFLLWAPDCKFSKDDIKLAAHIFSNPETSSCIIVNCDCENYKTHLDLLNLADLVLVRENNGYDWGAYKDLLLKPEFHKFQYLTIINNSIQLNGNDNSWIKKQEKIAIESNGVAGAVESAYPSPHLQSFSLTFTRAALSKGLEDWVRKIRYTNNKFYVVRHYEIGLSAALKSFQIERKALLPFSTFYPWVEENWEETLHIFSKNKKYIEILHLMQNNLSINPTHALWRFILARNIPIIKKELLLKNPVRMPDVSSSD
jgi:hypothetical protein